MKYFYFFINQPMYISPCKVGSTQKKKMTSLKNLAHKSSYNLVSLYDGEQKYFCGMLSEISQLILAGVWSHMPKWMAFLLNQVRIFCNCVSEVVSNFLRWNLEPNTLLLSTYMTHDFEKNISPLLVARPWKSDIWDTIVKNPDLIERKGHSFGHMWPKTCQNQLRYLRQHLVCCPVLLIYIL